MKLIIKNLFTFRFSSISKEYQIMIIKSFNLVKSIDSKNYIIDEN